MSVSLLCAWAALTARRFYMFPHHIETTSFGVSCDAFANLKETLTRHKAMVADYLDKNYDRVRVHLPWSFPVFTRASSLPPLRHSSSPTTMSRNANHSNCSARYCSTAPTSMS